MSSPRRPLGGVPALLSALVLAAPVCLAQDDATATWTVDRERSLLAVVTGKEGLAAGLGHEHLVVARGFDVSLRFDRSRPAATICDVEVPVAELVIDDPGLQQEWQAELLERGLITEEFADISEKNRRKIRRSMLGSEQLDADAHPALRARLHEVRVENGEAVARLDLVVKGKSAASELRFPWPETRGADEVVVEATARFAFTDFGIEPYSALLGAIRVADPFDVVIRLVAVRKPSPSP